MIGITKKILKNLGEKVGVCKSEVNVLLIRDRCTEDSTQGKLYINGEYQCETLERPWLDNKKSVSCIPKGNYKMRFRYPRESASYDYLHLLVQDVPNRDFILFHVGNRTKDSRGCILTGQTRKDDFVGLSRKAHTNLMETLIEKGVTDNINLIIKNR
jgi:hypothetical protein